MVAGALAVAGTSCAGQTPAISCSGEVERAEGFTAEALASFIGAGAGKGHGHGMVRCGGAGPGAGRALVRSGRVEHVEVFFCPCSDAC
jgi:hypothetical protein